MLLAALSGDLKLDAHVHTCVCARARLCFSSSCPAGRVMFVFLIFTIYFPLVSCMFSSHRRC